MRKKRGLVAAAVSRTKKNSFGIVASSPHTDLHSLGLGRKKRTTTKTKSVVEHCYKGYPDRGWRWWWWWWYHRQQLC